MFAWRTKRITVSPTCTAAPSSPMETRSVRNSSGAFVGALMDLDDERAQRYRALPPGVILADGEPRWLTRLRSWFGR
jgi:hypothetical protein